MIKLSVYLLDCVSKDNSVIVEICTKILVVPSKTLQCFLPPNWRHLLGFLSNYSMGEKIDKHAFNCKEEYFLKFRGPESCILTDKIMNLLIESRISWLNLFSFLHKFAKVRRENP